MATTHRRLNLSAVEDFCVLNGLSHAELARRSDLSESYVSELFAGRKTGSSLAWKRIAEALGVQLTSIIAIEEAA